jgi:hypothetical protein
MLHFVNDMAIPSELSNGDAISNHNGPSVAPQFTASLQFEGNDSQLLPMGKANGSLVYDAHVEAYAMQNIIPMDKFGPDVVMHQATLVNGSGKNALTYATINGACYNFTGGLFAQGGFPGLFGWLALANKTGLDTVDGVTCDVWSYAPPPPFNKFPTRACLHGDQPLYMIRYQGNVQKMYFRDFQRSADRRKFSIPAACLQKPKTCGSNTIVQKTIYVAHPVNDYNITGQDVADARGDAVFLCIDEGMATLGNYSLLSAFELSLVDTYSEYTNFPPPGTQGFGGDGFHVGRGTPLTIGRSGGQCDDDAELRARLGTWYSLPRIGQCLTEADELGVNCTWRIERRMKTIELGCVLKKHGLLDRCEKAKAPFSEVLNILLKALASEDITRGGCQSTTAPLCKAHPACAHLNGDCCPHQNGAMFDCCNVNFSSSSVFV